MSQIKPMNIFHYLICVNILTLLPVIGKNIIFTECHKYRKKRNGDQSVEAPKKKTVAEVIIEGPRNQISSFPVEDLLNALNATRNSEIVPQHHIEEIWELLKNGRKVDTLEVKDLKKMGVFLDKIPNEDLFYFDMTKWDIVEVLGKEKQFRSHQMGILAASLISTHGSDILRNHTNLNRIYGLICGLNEGAVNSIPDEEFVKINSEVFNYLTACTRKHLRQLLQKSFRPTIFGPPQVWTAETVATANMLILGMTPNELVSLRPPALMEFSDKVLQLLDRDQLEALTPDQIARLGRYATLIYREKTYLRSSTKQLYYKSNMYYILMLVLMNTYHNRAE